MDPIKNPFSPGAGSPPPALVGRKAIIEEATINIQRASLGNSCRPQMLLGLRGVGKTVLLNHIEDIAKDNSHITTMIEAYEGIDLVKALKSEIQQLFKKLSTLENLKDKVHRGVAVFLAFLSNFNFDIGGIGIEVEPEIGSADSGKLEQDLAELFLVIGGLAREAKRPWSILIDEVQYLNKEDLAALIVALHKCSQKNVPILFFGAGLPQIAAMSGDAKSYAERLFSYPYIGALPQKEAESAIKQPIEELNESISDEALKEITYKTKGYPYFLQEWGAQTWNAAENNQEIGINDVYQASEAVFNNLDNGFFSVRLDRLTAAEKEYVIAMAALGSGPYKSSDIAKVLKKTISGLSTIRTNIIVKGMIYSPAYGEVDFTVPLFDDFLRRQYQEHSLLKSIK